MILCSAHGPSLRSEGPQTPHSAFGWPTLGTYRVHTRPVYRGSQQNERPAAAPSSRMALCNAIDQIHDLGNTLECRVTCERAHGARFRSTNRVVRTIRVLYWTVTRYYPVPVPGTLYSRLTSALPDVESYRVMLSTIWPYRPTPMIARPTGRMKIAKAVSHASPPSGLSLR